MVLQLLKNMTIWCDFFYKNIRKKNKPEQMKPN